MEPTEPAADNSTQQAPAESVGALLLFDEFDRRMLTQCVEKMLSDKEWREMILELIKAATVKDHPEPQHGRRWLHVKMLKSWGLNNAQTYAPNELIDLHKLHQRLPSYSYRKTIQGYSWGLLVVYLSAGLFSLLLNLITLMVLAKIANDKLRRYLINLTVSGLLMSCFVLPICLADILYDEWFLPNFLCSLSHSFVTLCVYVSTLTMMAIGMNRYSAIMHPLEHKMPAKIGRVRVRQMHVIVAIWLVGIGLSSPDYYYMHMGPICYKPKHYMGCRFSILKTSIGDSHYMFIDISTFLLPLALLSVIYSRLAVKIRRLETPGNRVARHEHIIQEKRMKVIKALFVVEIVFVITWLPFKIGSLVDFFDPLLFLNIEQGIIKAYNFTIYGLVLVHSCANPVIYCFMSGKFRRNFKRLALGPNWPPLRCHCCGNKSAKVPALALAVRKTNSMRAKS